MKYKIIEELQRLHTQSLNRQYVTFGSFIRFKELIEKETSKAKDKKFLEMIENKRRAILLQRKSEEGDMYYLEFAECILQELKQNMENGKEINKKKNLWDKW